MPVGVLDLFLAFGVLACRILDCASWLCGLLSDKLCCLRLKLELLAFGILRNYCESLSMFSSFVSAGVEFHVLALAFGVLAGRLCFVREVALFKLEKNTFGLNLDLSTPSRSVYDCEGTWISSA